MHEFSVATQIFESLLQFAAANKAGRIVKVKLEIGELTCIATEQLRFCFQSIATRSALEDCDLEIESAPASVKCPYCHYSGPPKYWSDALAGVPIPTMQCPGCGNATEETGGHDCAIKSVQFVPVESAITGKP